MLNLKLAKPMMENEEGMNHLWVQLFWDEKDEYQNFEIKIQLPTGIYRSQNLNGYMENERGNIVVNTLNQDVIVEVFTQETIECGEVTIVVSLITSETTISSEISLQLVEEDEMDIVEIDEQVVERIKVLSNEAPLQETETNIVSIHPRILQKRENEFSHLEKKYRVDY